MSSNKKWAAKRDANEGPIVDALKAAGATVRRLSETGVPDLIVGIDGANYLLEVKDKGGKLTEAEDTFFNEWQGQKTIVRTPEEALRAIGR
jgi:hypothetical protein